MASSRGDALSSILRHLAAVTETSPERVVVVDVNQEIRWANPSALVMHKVESCDALGRTIFDYHAKFQTRFGSCTRHPDGLPDDKLASDTAQECKIEVTFPGGTGAPSEYRVRNLVLVDDAGNPICVVLVFRLPDEAAASNEALALAAASLPAATAIIRVADSQLGAVGGMFLDMVGPDIAFASRRDDATCAVLPNSALPSQEAVTIAAPEVVTDAVAIRMMCELMPTSLAVLDNEMRVLDVSEPFLGWLAFPRREVIGRKLVDLMAQPTAAHFFSQNWPNIGSMVGAVETESQFLTKSGGVVDCILSTKAILNNDARLERVIVSVTDISDRKNAADVFTKMFGLSPVPMLIRKLDDTRILSANDAFLAATDRLSTSVIGHGIEEMGIFETRADRQQFETAVKSDGIARNFDVRVKTAHGDTLSCLLSGFRVYAFGQTCILLILQDISDRRRNEGQLFEALEIVMKDTTWFSRSVIERLAALRSPPKNGGRSAALDDLTPRELEVLVLISQGLADPDIASKLGLTRSTIRNHVATLYSKIGVHSRSSAIIWARERGMNIEYLSHRATSLSPVLPKSVSRRRAVWPKAADPVQTSG